MALNYAQGIDALVAGICFDFGQQTTYALDTDWVYEAAGDKAIFCRFTAPVSQTAGALTFYAYCTAVTGAAAINIEVRNGPVGTDPRHQRVDVLCVIQRHLALTRAAQRQSARSDPAWPSSP